MEIDAVGFQIRQAALETALRIVDENAPISAEAIVEIARVFEAYLRSDASR